MKTTMLTPHEAKLYFSEKLPERIFVAHRTATEPAFYWIKGSIPCEEILETEWEQIRLWVEEKVPKYFELLYLNECLKLCYKPEKESWLSGTHILKLLKQDYTTRSTAMKESGL